MKGKPSKVKHDKQKDCHKDEADKSDARSNNDSFDYEPEIRQVIELPPRPSIMQTISQRLEEEDKKKEENHEKDPSEVILRKRDLKASQKGKVNIEKLIFEHEKKKLALEEVHKHRQRKIDDLCKIREEIGKKMVSFEPKNDRKTHWNYMLSEMKWMANDFDRERRDQKNNRLENKQLDEKKHLNVKQKKEEQLEVKRKANYISKLVQKFWKACEKVVKHNYNLEYEKKKQKVREKRLNHFVNKHLKLSSKVASSLHEKTKFASVPLVVHEEVEDKGPIVIESNEALPVMGSKIGNDHMIFDDEVEEEEKLDKMTITVRRLPNGNYEYVSHNIPEEDEYDSTDKQKLAEEQIEIAAQFQPLGHDLTNVQVNTKIPFLLRGNLREYQVIGLDWLKTLHDKKLNGILADEMGLGKTIQTIALLASLACEEGIWGPHLIVVPTTIIINWEMEFKRWCPGLKILTYFGSQKERKLKRTGWSKDNSFHVCITSYKLVIQDHFAFRRKKWYYMVLDEAQNIKNFRSQRWQTLLRFNTKRRLLLTGTPLQNDVMELWSLMHFLMPNIFSSQQDFKEWFSNPFNQSMNQNQSLNLLVVQRLQSILRPFLLRRMKKDVEKQLPEKIEHIVKCELSRRQRFLYDEYINNNKTQKTLHEADFFSIMNVLMQLRKVCNHPDLFEARPIESPFFQTDKIVYTCPKLIWKTLDLDKDFVFKQLNMILQNNEDISKKTFASQIENFPQRSFVEALQNARMKSNGTLCTMRPLEEGDSIGVLKPINCNELSINNTDALSISFPGNIPFTFLGPASMPFLSSYFSIDSLDELRYSGRDIRFNPQTDYVSALQAEEYRLKLLKFGEKLITFAHADYHNRMKLMCSPVYGKDCIEACKVSLTFENIFRHKKCKTSSNIKDLEITHTIFNPLCKETVKHEILYNRFANTTFSIENALQYDDEKVKSSSQNLGDSSVVPETRLSLTKKNSKQFGCPLIIELKSKKSKSKSKKSKQQIINMPYKPKIGSTLSPVYSNMHGKVMYLMSAKLLKNVTMSIPKSIIGMKNKDYPHPTVENDVTVDVKDIVIHKKKKVKPYKESAGIYEKEYNTTSEYRRMKKLGSDNQDNEDYEDESSEEEQAEEENSNIHAEEEQEKEEEKEQQQDLKDDQLVEENKEQDLDHQQNMEVDDDQQNNNNSIEEQKQPDEEGKETGDKAENVDGAENVNEQKETHDEKTKDTKINETEDKQDDDSEEEYSGEGCFIGYRNSETLKNMVFTPLQILDDWNERLKHFKFITPKVRAKPAEISISKVSCENDKKAEYEDIVYKKVMFHKSISSSLKFTNSLYFPHRNLVQYDCGKLHKLSMLLKTLKSKGSKVLIFTQMTKMLDLLEQFLNLHGYTYVRLDGSVKVEMRQKLVDNFNLNKKIFCFISSTRCGGIGINLTGADCVVFYDTDWNPAMDKQAQDRCHRIGQEKTVHIYRLISMNTIEENIFKKSLQKRELGGMIIEGNFDPDFFKKVNYKEILEEGNIIKPRKLDIMKEENIVFNSGLEDDKDDKDTAEAYKRKYEEVLIRIEDQEDVDAYQNAKREIDDEFEDIDTGSPTAKESNATGNDEERIKEKKIIQKEDALEIILNSSTTKYGINYVKSFYSFDQFIKDKSEKDSKFVDPEEEYKLQKETEERERLSEDLESESSEVSAERENYDPEESRKLYMVAQQEIPGALNLGMLTK